MRRPPITHQGPTSPASALMRHASRVESWTHGANGPTSLEDALEQAQLNLLRGQELFDFAPEGYLITDLQGIILQANYAAAAMLQTRKEFLVGKPLLFYVA